MKFVVPEGRGVVVVVVVCAMSSPCLGVVGVMRQVEEP